MTRTIKLTIEYEGTHFFGWQIQKGHKKSRTIQGEIAKSLKKIFHQNCLLIGSGRTDRGVHAIGQVAHFKVNTHMSPREIQNALNAHLPPDIAIIRVEDVPEGFHAQFNARSKTYRYTILNRPGRCSLERNTSLHIPYKLNLKAMRDDAQCLIGRKDFKSFAAKDPANPEDTIRTIKRLAIRKRKDFIIIDIEANGFLYKMVRNIIGTLLEIGSGKLPKGSIRRILAKKNRALAGQTAKPHGLTLLEVRY